MAAVAASPGYPGLAGLSDHSSLPAKEEEAKGQPDQFEDPEGEPKSGQRDRHRGPEKHKYVLLSLLALQNGKLTTSLMNSQPCGNVPVQAGDCAALLCPLLFDS